MFCTNCGSEIYGKFCANCGESIENTESSVKTSEIVNGMRIDFDELYLKYKNDENSAIQIVNTQTGIGIFKAIKIVKEEFKKRRPSGGLWGAMKEQVQDQQKAQFEMHERVKQMDKDGTAYCPKCYSTSLSANKKGFSFGKAVAGGLVAPIGLLAGGIGANKVQLTCMKCGNKFKPGQK